MRQSRHEKREVSIVALLQELRMRHHVLSPLLERIITAGFTNEPNEWRVDRAIVLMWLDVIWRNKDLFLEDFLARCEAVIEGYYLAACRIEEAVRRVTNHDGSGQYAAFVFLVIAASHYRPDLLSTTSEEPINIESC